MHRKRLIITLLCLLATLTVLAGPKSKDALSHIKFGKCRIVSIVPTGLRSVRAGVEFETRNDTTAFLLQDVKLAIFRKGEPFAEGLCEEVSVPKGASKVRVTGEFELCDEVSLWSAVSALRNPDFSEFSGNVDLTVVSGKGRKYAYSEQNISMGSLGVRPTNRKADVKGESSDGKTSSGKEQVSEPDKRAETTAKPSEPPAAQKQKKARKRPWWQFWKK